MIYSGNGEMPSFTATREVPYHAIRLPKHHIVDVREPGSRRPVVRLGRKTRWTKRQALRGGSRPRRAQAGQGQGEGAMNFLCSG